MLDIKYIRENLDRVTSRLKLRGPGFSEDLELLVELDVRRRTALKRSETLKNKKKSLSAEVGKLKKEGNDAGLLVEEVKTINARIKQFDDEFRDVENKIRDKLLRIPNLPDEKTPEGSDETQNEILRHWGEKPECAFKPKSHVELGEKGGLQIIGDFIVNRGDAILVISVLAAIAIFVDQGLIFYDRLFIILKSKFHYFRDILSGVISKGTFFIHPGHFLEVIDRLDIISQTKMVNFAEPEQDFFGVRTGGGDFQHGFKYFYGAVVSAIDPFFIGFRHQFFHTGFCARYEYE